MNLDDAQREKVANWVAEGLKLAEVQKRLESDFGIRMTYMDVRFLVDDLKLTLKDPVVPKSPDLTTSGVQTPITPNVPPIPGATKESKSSMAGGKVSVSVDSLARAGALVSGTVTFSDGNKAEWHLDQTGRLGLVTQVPGYRPAPGDVQQFQSLLEAELSKLGF